MKIQVFLEVGRVEEGRGTWARLEAPPTGLTDEQSPGEGPPRLFLPRGAPGLGRHLFPP